MKTLRTALLIPVLFFVSAMASAADAGKRDFNAVLALSGDLERGQEIFGQCTRCHGVDGGGAVAGTVPRIAGQHYRVLVRQLVAFRRGQRWDFQMEGVATSHGAIPELQDIADVARYVSELDRDGARGVGSGQFLERGAAIYASACASCHGAQGEGNGAKDIPRISGQHEGYLTRQIYDAVDDRRPPLSRTHGKRFAPLSFEEVQGLSDYLSRIGWRAEE